MNGAVCRYKYNRRPTYSARNTKMKPSQIFNMYIRPYNRNINLPAYMHGYALSALETSPKSTIADYMACIRSQGTKPFQDIPNIKHVDDLHKLVCLYASWMLRQPCWALALNGRLDPHSSPHQPQRIRYVVSMLFPCPLAWSFNLSSRKP